jgi:hypothetical protein
MSIEQHEIESLFGWMRLSATWGRESKMVDAMWAEIDRLRLENEKLAAAMSSDGADACGALVVAEAEIERLRKDAARYRFIRQDISGLGVYIVNGNLEVLSLNEADKAIDASRKEVGDE